MTDPTKRAEEGSCKQCGNIYLAEPALCSDCLDKKNAAALEQAYRRGVEAMRDAAHPLMRWPEDHEGLDAVAARLLSKSEEVKP
jgi:hypothetical protein